MTRNGGNSLTPEAVISLYPFRIAAPTVRMNLRYATVVFNIGYGIIARLS